MKLLVFVLSLGFVSSWSSSSRACNQVQNLANNINITNNPNPIMNFRIRRNQFFNQCEYVIGITKGDSNDGTYNRRLQRNQIYIPIQMWDTGVTQVLKTIPDTTPPANMLTGTFTVQNPSANTQDREFQVLLGPVPYGLPHGTYENVWRVQLFTRPLNSNQAYSLANDRDFRLRYTVSTSLDLSLVPTGAPFDLLSTNRSVNFGLLQQNDIRSFDMIIGNNTAYSYTLTSTNNGRLVRIGSPGDAPNRVDYEFQIGATSYTPTVVINPGQFPHNSPIINPPASSEVRYPIQIRITGNPSTKNQGTYQDTITIELTAN